ncbi:MAG: alpha/beta hydrolase [Dolichospermum sp.]
MSGRGEVKKLPITNYPLPITHYQLPITPYPLPITHYQLPITNYPLPTQHEGGLIDSIFPRVQ